MVPTTAGRARRGGICAGLAAMLGAVLAAGLLPGDPGLRAAAAAAELPTPIVQYDIDADDLASGTITDSSGNGLHGTLVNGATAAPATGADGGQALNLPGGPPTSNGAYVTLPRQILAGRTDLTVSVRVRWDGAGGPWQWMYALGKDTSRYLFSTPSNNDGRLRTAVTTNYGTAEAQVTGSAALPANAWKTVTVTLDTAAGRLTTSRSSGPQSIPPATPHRAASPPPGPPPVRRSPRTSR